MQRADSGLVTAATPHTPLDSLSRIVRVHGVASVPVVEDGRVVTLVTAVDMARVAGASDGDLQARDIMSRPVIRAFPDESLNAAWLRMSRRGLRQLAVVERGDSARLVGLITMRTIGEGVRLPMLRQGLAAGRPQKVSGGPKLTEPAAADMPPVPAASQPAATATERQYGEG